MFSRLCIKWTHTCLVFMNGMFSWLHLFLWQTQKTKNNSPLSLENKKQLLPARFSLKSCYVDWVINCNGKLICLHTYLHNCNHAGLTDRPNIIAKNWSHSSTFILHRYCIIKWMYFKPCNMQFFEVWLVGNFKQFCEYFIQHLLLENDCCTSQNVGKMKGP